MPIRLFIVKLIINVLVMIHIVSCMYTFTAKMIHLKPANCFLPGDCFLTCRYDGSYVKKAGYEFATWHLSPYFNACFPYFIKAGKINDCCPGLINRPRTRKECEDMCGEPCIVTHPNYMTEPGICTSLCHIELKSPPGIPLECLISDGSSDLKAACCPRGYEIPHDQFDFKILDYLGPMLYNKTVSMKLTWHQGNKSMSIANVSSNWTAL